MIPMSRYALMGGTVAAAVGIGYFMQTSATGEIRQTRPTGVQIASADATAGADLRGHDCAPACSLLRSVNTVS